MSSTGSRIAFHLALIGGIVVLILWCVLYPFLPGQHDPLAVPLSMAAQLFGALGTLLAPIGLGWLVHEARKHGRRHRGLPLRDRSYRFALAAAIAGSLIMLAVSAVLLFAFNVLPGVLGLALWAYGARKARPVLTRLRASEAGRFNPAPLYLVLLPGLTLFGQLALAAPATAWSRDRAIARSAELIDDIEQHFTAQGRYPLSLLALHPDYLPSVVGIARYQYAPSGAAYHLSFEQPTFLLDNFGTREIVMYNKHDEHVMPSHAHWILIWTPEVLAGRQGWYAAHDTPHPHWKYFWFD